MALQAGNQFEALMAAGQDLSELRDRTAKALENACRIAGVLAAIEGGMGTSEIAADHLARGLVLIQWYLSETLRIRGAEAVPQSVQDAEALSNWLQARGVRRFATTGILKSGPAHLRNSPRLMAAIEQLVEAGYITALPGRHGDRRREGAQGMGGASPCGLTLKPCWRALAPLRFLRFLRFLMMGRG